MTELDFSFERQLELGVKSALKEGKEEAWAEANKIIEEKNILLNEKDEEIKRLKELLKNRTE